MKKSLLFALAVAASSTASAALPTTTGWYKIQIVDGTSPTGGTEILNDDAEYRQSNTNSYALRFGTSDENKPAKSFIHVTVTGSTYQFTSINGHGVKENATSDRAQLPTSNPAVTASGDNVHIGHWTTFTPTTNNPEGITYIGRSSSANHTFAMSHVSDDVLSQYDIWSVYIDLRLAGQVIDDAQIAYDSDNNKGITSVYNGGKFFVTKGTTISESDLTLVHYNRNYDLVIDNEQHTITVTEQSAVATNKYIRIGAKSEGYYYDMAADGDPCFSQDTNSAIYYYDANKRLVHYGEGRAAIKNPSNTSYLNKATSAVQNADFLHNTHGISFIACTNAAATGRYFLTWFYSTSKPYALLYCYPSGVSDHPLGSMGNGSTTDSDLQGLASNQNWTFSVEDVTELPVKIGADGKGTMIVPVAVTVPTSDNFTFYTASTNADDKLVFAQAQAGTTIPANTHIVIKRASSCSDTTCSVSIATESANEAIPAALAETSERFLGSYLATTAPAPAEGEIIYVKKQTLDENETAGDNDVVFKKVNVNDVLPAGALAFRAKNTSTDEAPATLTLDLTADNSGTTTSINSIFVENEHATDAIFDLQGRRLCAPVKGINIINGRKVLVK